MTPSRCLASSAISPNPKVKVPRFRWALPVLCSTAKHDSDTMHETLKAMNGSTDAVLQELSNEYNIMGFATRLRGFAAVCMGSARGFAGPPSAIMPLRFRRQHCQDPAAMSCIGAVSAPGSQSGVSAIQCMSFCGRITWCSWRGMLWSA